ncbi:hypothetical protein, partial [Vibrio vulnificus]|uniref:hypothetical protein n=1 Tax=Vibrio vulnificus TaxID=672 RepID=UPI001EECEE86
FSAPSLPTLGEQQTPSSLNLPGETRPVVKPFADCAHKPFMRPVDVETSHLSRLTVLQFPRI